MTRLALALKRYRQMGEISQRDLCKQIGLNVSTYHRFENGEQCSAENLAKILRWLLENNND